MIADSAGVASLVGVKPQLAWPAGHGLRRIPLRDPTPVYPHSFLWRGDNPHPGLAALCRHLVAAREPEPEPGPSGADPLWTPPIEAPR